MAGIFSQIFGSRPDVPNLPALNFGEQQGIAVGNNTANLPGIENLANLVNNFSQEQWDKALEAALPSYSSRKGIIAGNILDLAEGKVPGDISAQVQGNAAARSLGGGYGGTGAGRNLVARDLGLTSLDLMDKGLSATNRWLAAAKAPTFDVSSMFITPTQQADFAIEERNAQWQNQYLKAQVDAMPDPVTHGIWSVIHQIGMSAINGLTGNAGGFSGDPSGASQAVTNAYAQQPLTSNPGGTFASSPADTMSLGSPSFGSQVPPSAGFDATTLPSAALGGSTGTGFDAAGNRIATTY